MSSTVSEERADQIAGGVFMIGMAFLFFTGYWWPGILFVSAASSLARGIAEGRAWYSVQGAVWMIGIGLVFAVGFSLPLLLIVVGLSTLLGYRYRPPFMEGDAAEAEIEDLPPRKLKNADGLEYYDAEYERELAFEEQYDLLLDDEEDEEAY
ncbi:MAG: hypothetical protein JXN59_13680 [Anaerolineae bacterium]|nr:hypothetical protein [Anaerolineae bacterium]